MSLKHINAGFFITIICFSVVHNHKHGKQQLIQEPNYSEIKRNITFVKHLLQDLLQKYELLQQLVKNHKENTNHKETKAYDFFKGDSKIKVRAKLRLAKTRKPFKTNRFQAVNFMERSEFGVNKNEKPRAKNKYDDDSLSVDSREHTSVTKRVKSLTKQNERELLERNVKFKESVKNDYSSERIMKDGRNEVTHAQDVEKVLVIHLGTKELHLKKNHASTTMQDFIPTTDQKMQPIKNPVLSESETTGSHESDIREEQEMQREMLRVKQLRAAVGNACSQVVVRTCQQAIRSVLVDVCKSTRKCSDEFNNDFTSNGIAACDSEFKKPVKNRGRYTDLEHNYPRDVQYENIPQQQDSQELTGAQFIDYTREGDLLVDMTCMQALSKITEPNVARTSVNNAKTQDVNVLRGQYEKACKQAAYVKCRTACNCAADKTCNKHDCITEKMKALKFSCKRRCKERNSVDDESSSSESSSSQSQSQSASSNTS